MKAINEVLALDVGKARIGVARASMRARIPEPVTTIETSKALELLNEIIDRYQTQAIVVGLPRSLHGDDTEQTRWVRQWITEAANHIKLPFYLQDEALTSAKALELAADDETKNQSQDALAASLILQDFLDTPKHMRVTH